MSRSSYEVNPDLFPTGPYIPTPKSNFLNGQDYDIFLSGTDIVLSGNEGDLDYVELPDNILSSIDTNTTYELSLSSSNIQLSSSDGNIQWVDVSTAVLPNINIPLSSALESKADKTNVLTLDGSTEISAPQKAALAVQWPEAVSSGSSVYVTPQDFGATGDGIGRLASSLFATLLEAQAVYPHCVALTEELDGLAVQAALNTGSRVYIPNGKYRLTSSISVTTRGQTIEGESATGTIFEWVADVDGIVINSHSNTDDPNPNGPGSAEYQNAAVTIENLWLIGMGASSTTRGLAIGPRVDPDNPGAVDWNGPRTTIRNVNSNGFQRGFEIQYASKIELSNTVAKACDLGYFFGSATNNCHRGERITVENCPVGMRIEGARGGYFALGDFANVDVGIEMVGGNATFVGGELESFDDYFFDIAGGKAVIISPRFLARGTYTTAEEDVKDGPIAIRLRDRASVFIAGQSYDNPDAATEHRYIAQIEDANSTITAPPTSAFRYGDFAASTGADDKVNTFVSTGVYAVRSISPFPLIGANSTVAESATTGMVWFEKPTANQRGGLQLVSHLENGDGLFYKSYLSQQDVLFKEVTGTNYAPKGWESVVKYTGTGVKNCNLPVTTATTLRANSVNGKSLTIYNANSSGNVTVNPNGADTINGVNATITLLPYESITLTTDASGDWMAK